MNLFSFKSYPWSVLCEDISIYYFVYHSDQGGIISLLNKYEKEGHHSVLWVQSFRVRAKEKNETLANQISIGVFNMTAS